MRATLTVAAALALALPATGAAAQTAPVPAPLAVPPAVRPVVVPSATPGVPAYVLVQAVFNRVVPSGKALFLEFRPVADPPAGDSRWHAMWFRPCEADPVVTRFVEAVLRAGEPVQIALPVNPPARLRAQLDKNCQAGGLRTPVEATRYASSLFAANLQSLRGEDAGVYLGGSLNSLVRLGRLRPLQPQDQQG